MNDFIKNAYEQGVSAALEQFGLKEAAWSANQEKALQRMTANIQSGSTTAAQRQQLDYLRQMKRKHEMGQKGWKQTGRHYKQVAQGVAPAQGSGSFKNIPKVAPAVVPSVAPAVQQAAPTATKQAPGMLQRLKSIPKGRAALIAGGLGLGALGFGAGRADAPDPTIGNTFRHYMG